MRPGVMWLDCETYSETPIKDGLYVYAASCEIDIISWAIDDGPVQHVDFQTCTIEDVLRVRKAIHQARVLVAHNAMFDRNVLRLGNLKIDTPIEKWRCTMVRALAHSMPGALEKIGELLKIPYDDRKLADGRKLMLLFCKPRPRNHKLRRATAYTHPAERLRYLAYCDHDVLAMRDIAARMPRWNMAEDYPADNGEPWMAGHTELAHWHRDQAMNDRGYAIDTHFAQQAVRAVEEEQKRLKKRTQEMTRGEVESATQRDKLLAFLLAEHGVTLPNLQKSTLERRLADPDLPDELREMLRVRLDVCTTSTAKYKSLINGTSRDGRLRGTIQMDGAGRTRRASGRTFQPHNQMRPTLEQPTIDAGIEAIKSGCESMVFDNIMEIASNGVRGAIIAPKQRKLVIADLSNIEGRGLAWVAGEDWKLQAFRDFDTVLGKDGRWYSPDEAYLGRPPLELDSKGEPIRKGPDLYKVAYGNSFGLRPEDVTKDQRQAGKVQELACGYQGSLGAFMTFAANYGLDLDAMAARILPTLAHEAIAQAQSQIDWRVTHKIPMPALTYDTTVAVLCMVNGWRAAHPATVALWANLEALAKAAIRNPDKLYEYRGLKFLRHKAWLRIQLPSGRSLCYPHPEIDKAGRISYMGVCQYTHQWRRLSTYGGKLCLAGNTPVMTRQGWLPLEKLDSAIEVWDGVEWVQPRGCLYNGNKLVYPIYGVYMTADHKVLTEKGWRTGTHCEKEYRAVVTMPDGSTPYEPIEPGGHWRFDQAVVRQVYDLIGSGPRNQFVVQGMEGLPVIVHNCENVIQGLSRDILYDAHPGIETAGYPLCFHVHDEDITETPDTSEYSAEELVWLMTRPPSWHPSGVSYAPDFPLAAAGFETMRYRKD